MIYYLQIFTIIITMIFSMIITNDYYNDYYYYYYYYLSYTYRAVIAHEGVSNEAMYRRNPLGKKTCKPLPVCCFALYRVDVSSYEESRETIPFLSFVFPFSYF